MGVPSGTYGGEERCTQGFGGEIWEDMGTDGMMMMMMMIIIIIIIITINRTSRNRMEVGVD
jgi:hypothetical protein